MKPKAFGHLIKCPAKLISFFVVSSLCVIAAVGIEEEFKGISFIKSKRIKLKTSFNWKKNSNLTQSLSNTKKNIYK